MQLCVGSVCCEPGVFQLHCFSINIAQRIGSILPCYYGPEQRLSGITSIQMLVMSSISGARLPLCLYGEKFPLS